MLHFKCCDISFWIEFEDIMLKKLWLVTSFLTVLCDFVAKNAKTKYARVTTACAFFQQNFQRILQKTMLQARNSLVSCF